ncbi:hypothetical protein [Methanothrix sp.]|uniref:hypothetical protein n=1 Tax=Methanothrix sp. TaxID=90426 RepID=UPI002C669927|nr:hypothetical protein [Methanothrix sp.]HOK57431.1 hypothetical protein [Methanothrix sp.]HOL42714.1 hypothetical protein [Methanothrix sp.]HPO87716.1 hypothetical protein [Methanothrix sp.]
MRCLTYPYPIETLRHWYVTPVGGRSSELDPGELGLNREAIVENTDLIPFEDRVLLSRLEGGSSRPLFARKYFRIVPLDSSKPDALSKSPLGEAILPASDNETDRIKVGEMVVINSVLSRVHTRGLPAIIDRMIRSRSDSHLLDVIYTKGREQS